MATRVQADPASPRQMSTTEKPSPLWSARLAKYRERSNSRAVLEILVTAVPFVGLWAGAWFAASASYWLAAVVAVPAAGFLVRLFMIQHDCGHGALFTRRSANDWVGRIIGVLTLTPYDCWRKDHNYHHAGAGNLDRRGIGDIATLTVKEYTALTPWARLKYRLYRHPLVMFAIGPVFLFVVQHRVPGKSQRRSRFAWVSTMGTNAATAIAIAALIAAVGLGPFLAVQVPVTIFASTAGVWLFYVQHQFEATYWARPPEWTPQAAALYGSSYLLLPRPLRWLTANIGLHHIHHVRPSIPNYNLQQCQDDVPAFQTVKAITLKTSFRSLRLSLCDVKNQQLVGFRSLPARRSK